MATRSAIGFKRIDGEILGIYCHYDGYLEHNGKYLGEHFNSRELAKALVSMGDMSGLGTTLEKNPDPNDGFKAFHDDEKYSTFYHRDRGEKLSISKFGSTVEFSMEMRQSGAEFLYLWDDAKDEWRWSTTGKRWNSLRETLKKRKLIA